MQKLWSEIEIQLSKLNFKLLEENNLNSAATNDELKSLSDTMKLEIPKEFIDFYKIHNGQTDDAMAIFPEGILLSIESIISEWNIWRELLEVGEFDECEVCADEGIKNCWWNIKWVPFISDGGGNNICLDLDPDTNGKYGQVITMWHDSQEREILADSFREFLENYLNKLKEGTLVYSEDYYGIVESEYADDYVSRIE